MDKIECETCKGSRLNTQTNYFLINEKSIHDLTNLDIVDLKKWFSKIETKLSKRKKIIASEIIKEINKRFNLNLTCSGDIENDTRLIFTARRISSILIKITIIFFLFKKIPTTPIVNMIAANVK